MPPVRINPALQARLRLPSTILTSDPTQVTGTRGVGVSGGVPGLLSVSPESQQLLREFEEATALDQNHDPHLAAPAAVLWGSGRGVNSGGRGGVRGGRGQKRKQLGTGRTVSASSAKAPRRSSSPLLSVEEQRELGALKGSFDWDALLDSALNGELSLDEEAVLSPIPPQYHHDLTVRGTHISLDHLQAGVSTAADSAPLTEQHQNMAPSDLEEETFLATAFLQDPWPEEEEVGGGATKVDFLCSSTVSIDQLFDLGDSLGGDISSKIESLL